MLNIISLGAGVQSSRVALGAARGEITPMPDGAIFADTQCEPEAVYRHLDWLEKQLPFPVYRVTAGNLWHSATAVRRTRDGQRTYISTGIPVYTIDGLKRGLGKRQCTRTFKIDPVVRKCRELLGLKRVSNKSPVLVEMWMGISMDEAHRMKPAAKPWIRARFPLIEARESRLDCLHWFDSNGYPRAPKSACTFCPFHDDEMWLSMEASELDWVVASEPLLQQAYAQASAIEATPYFHSDRKPLAEVIAELKDGRKKPTQFPLFGNECEGMCGV